MLITQAPKGTEDLLPQDSFRWQYLEKSFKEVCDNFGYREIRMPTFEHTELFERGVGDTTDVVQKQMYTFLDKGGRSITLRPEGTASAARSFLQNSLYAQAMPIKMFYNLACFRYENKQKGRLREFHQFGVEAFGSKGPSIDAEIISLAITFLSRVGLKDLSVNINSIGCPECRKKYNYALKEYFRPHLSKLCSTCNDRFERNPLRILDCKSEICQEIGKGAPTILEYICDDCREHFEKLQQSLKAMEIDYTINPYIVRGLDYYTKTVFEIISGPFTVCGGGRYDGMIEEFGGDSTPGIGFGLGIERLLIRLGELGVEIPKENDIELYIAALGDAAGIYTQKLALDLRKQSINVEVDHMMRSLKAQMKYANKIGSKFSVVIGDNEISENTVSLKNMETGMEEKISLDSIAKVIKGGNE